MKVTANEIDCAISTIDMVRKDAQSNPRYGFDYGWGTFSKIMRLLTSQSSGGRIQNYIFESLGWTSVPSSEGRGDVKNNLGQYFEVKTTMITTSNGSMNIVQIRLWQNISGYHVFVIDTLKNNALTHFFLSKSEMAEEVNLLGQSAHGTKSANAENNNKEWAVRIRWGLGEDFERWIKKYKQDTHLDGREATASIKICKDSDTPVLEYKSGVLR